MKITETQLRKMVRKEAQCLTEGTWSLNTERIPDLIKQLEAFQNACHGVAGDDDLFDHIGHVRDRLDEMLTW